MLGINVSIPIACFRKGLAREYLETYDYPPPSTCYGFLLSLVGETERERHIGARITATILGAPSMSIVLRTIWRVKAKPLGSPGNTRPDYQQLLTGTDLIVWLDSSMENRSLGPTLEERVRIALDPKRRGEIERFGGLSFGESSHLVDEVSLYESSESVEREDARVFVVDPNGLETTTVWVDHVGSAGTRYVTGTFKKGTSPAPDVNSLPIITPDNRFEKDNVSQNTIGSLFDLIE